MAVPGKAPGCKYRMESEETRDAIVKRNGKWHVLKKGQSVSAHDDYSAAVKAASDTTDFQK